MICASKTLPWMVLGALLLFCNRDTAAQEMPHIGLKATAEPGSTSGTYQVRLDWEMPAEETQFEIYRVRLQGDPEEIKVPIDWLLGNPGFGPGEGPEQTWVDSKVLPATRYRYEVRPRHGAVREPESEEVEIPGRELEIRGRRKLVELDLTSRPIHRLVLRQGAELVTEGRDLKIDVIELVAENAVLLTFPEGSVAAPEKPGRPGGSISIHAERGSGTLTILGRGEKGGQGKKGDKGRTGEKGKTGKASRSAMVGPRGEKTMECVQEAEKGGSGGQGGVGTRGLQGAPGGDSAKIEVSIAQASSLTVEARRMPGEGGEGGEGGDGGDRGPGGDGGNKSQVCQPGEPGSPGDPGPRGPKGEAGQPGSCLTCSVRLGGKAVEDCEACQ